MAACQDAVYASHIDNIITHEDLRRAQLVRDDLYRVVSTHGIHRSVSDLHVVVRGSCATGLGLRNAAVDIALSIRLVPRSASYVRIPSHGYPVTDFEAIISSVRDAAVGSNIFRHVYTRSIGIRPSKEDEPCLHLHHKRTRSLVLIVIMVNGYDSFLLTNLQMSYATINQFVKPMIVFLKSWAKSEELTGPRKKLTGFIISLMVIFHQQRRAGMPAFTLPSTGCTDESIFQFTASCRRMIGPRNSFEVTKQLDDFFNFYSDFDFSCAIDIRTGEEILEPPTSWRYDQMKIIHPTRGTEGRNISSRIDLKTLKDLRAKMESCRTLFSATDSESREHGQQRISRINVEQEDLRVSSTTEHKTEVEYEAMENDLVETEDHEDDIPEQHRSLRRRRDEEETEAEDEELTRTHKLVEDHDYPDEDCEKEDQEQLSQDAQVGIKVESSGSETED